MMRNLLSDIGAALLFLAVLLVTNDIFKATAAGMLFGLVQAGWAYRTKRGIKPRQLLGVGLIIVMGGATIILRDPLYVMLKPTVLLAFMGAAMLAPGWLYRYLPPRAVERLPRRFVVVAGFVYALCTFALAIGNMLVATLAGQTLWAAYSVIAPALVFGLLGALFFLGGRMAARGHVAAPAEPG